MRRPVLVGLLSAALLSLAPRPAQAGDRVRIFLNGTFAATGLDFAESRKFTQFAEQGTIDAKYKEKTAPGFEGGLQFRLTSHLGVAASFSTTKRDGSASFSAALPHPLYLNEHRPASGDVGDLSYKENAGQLDLVLTGSRGSWDFVVFGGATLFNVTADLVKRIDFSQSYPYDSVTVTGVPKTSASDSPVGFNAGGGLGYRLSPHFGLGAQVKFSRATAKLVPSEGNMLEIDAGGLQVAAGARIFF